MKVLVAGATGAIGRALVPQLRAAGHDVYGMTRTPEKTGALRLAGAEPVVADGLDRDQVLRAVRATRPDAIVHEMTALTQMGDNPRRFGRDFAVTNRLRTEGTDNLLEAARRNGVSRFVAQSYAGWPCARVGGPVKAEDDPLDDDPPKQAREALDAIKHLERVVLGAEGIDGIVLRYGGFYGPNTSLDEGGVHVETIRKRRFPVAGGGGGVWSFVHVDDAAAATVAALERGRPGIYNVVDDDPAPVREWLPALAAMLGAPEPRRVPRWMARLFAGELGVSMMTQVRGASNSKAKRELGWQPRYPSWREGFAATLRGGDTRVTPLRRAA